MARAMGWLGWTPKTVLNANIPHLEMAIREKIHWAKMTNPFGSEDKEQEALDNAPSDAIKAMEALVGIVEKRQKNANQTRKKRVVSRSMRRRMKSQETEIETVGSVGEGTS